MLASFLLPPDKAHQRPADRSVGLTSLHIDDRVAAAAQAAAKTAGGAPHPKPPATGHGAHTAGGERSGSVSSVPSGSDASSSGHSGGGRDSGDSSSSSSSGNGGGGSSGRGGSGGSGEPDEACGEFTYWKAHEAADAAAEAAWRSPWKPVK